MKNQAGPAQDPWPPNPSQNQPVSVATIHDSDKDSIGNPIGNTIEKRC